MGVIDYVKESAGGGVEPKKGEKQEVRLCFDRIPENLSELKALKEAKLDSPFATAALSVLVLCGFEKKPDAVFEMLDFLKGPEDVSNYDKQFIKERLSGKQYKTFSFFEGAAPENNYEPAKPYRIVVSTTPYSFDNENWAVMYVKSSGADSVRPIKLRKKPSTGEWFLNELQCLSDIRVPVSADPWA